VTGRTDSDGGYATFRLAVVGAGPNATYALERLAATVSRLPAGLHLDLHVLDPTGEFGAGAVHSWSQPRSSYLNRIAGQVAFAADESVTDAGALLPRPLRPTLYEWCRARFAETAEPDFDVAREEWPKRYVHGLALRDAFASSVATLRRHPWISVSLHPVEAVDAIDMGPRLRLVAEPDLDLPLFDRLLLVTGHSHRDSMLDSRTAPLVRFAAERAELAYVPSPYPLPAQLPWTATAPGRVVGCAGMGLSAIDVLLYLTEGRGGRFVPAGGTGQLRYVASGREPTEFVVASSSGLFTFARPFNRKEGDLAQLQHRGVFLTCAVIDRLRASHGQQPLLPGGPAQLNFERGVLPLVLLEMAYVYYRTLLGPDFGDALVVAASPGVEQFLAGGTVDSAQYGLLQPVDDLVDEAVDWVDGLLAGSRPAELAETGAAAAAGGWDVGLAVRRFIQVVLGIAPSADPVAVLACVRAADAGHGLVSPWRHDLRLAGNRFDWARMIRPISSAVQSPEEYQDALLDFLDRDHLWATQGNLDNPMKAACDGVWRDLRGVLGYAVDRGGLDAASHRVFLETYMRHHNRLSDGAPLEAMEKVRALLRHGLLDASIGPDARVEIDEDAGRFRLVGTVTGAVRHVDTLVDAHVQRVHPAADVRHLYRNLHRRGTVRPWRNVSADGHHYEPGGLDLTPDFHPVRRDGSTESRITVLGPPSDGVVFFQVGALRPDQNHHVMRDVLVWLRTFWDAVGKHRSDSLFTPAGARS